MEAELSIRAGIRHLSAGAALLAVLLFPAVAPAQENGLSPPRNQVILRVSGNILHTNAGDEAHFDRAMIEALPIHRLETSTAVTDGTNLFEGVLMRDLLEAVGARGEVVTATALNDYTIDIPMGDFTEFGVIAAFSMDGKRLLPRDKGPLWIVYPRDDHAELLDIRYDYRWVWQLDRLEVR
ncbi:MAG: molybdopterin-dependent oxidoreductase [Gemmobacter sp.]